MNFLTEASTEETQEETVEPSLTPSAEEKVEEAAEPLPDWLSGLDQEESPVSAESAEEQKPEWISVEETVEQVVVSSEETDVSQCRSGKRSRLAEHIGSGRRTGCHAQRCE